MPNNVHKTAKMYPVEKILDAKVQDGVVWCLVKWKGYGSNKNSWEPMGNFEGPKDVLKEMDSEQPAEKIEKNSKNTEHLAGTEQPQVAPTQENKYSYEELKQKYRNKKVAYNALKKQQEKNTEHLAGNKPPKVATTQKNKYTYEELQQKYRSKKAAYNALKEQDEKNVEEIIDLRTKYAMKDVECRRFENIVTKYEKEKAHTEVVELDNLINSNVNLLRKMQQQRWDIAVLTAKLAHSEGHVQYFEFKLKLALDSLKSEFETQMRDKEQVHNAEMETLQSEMALVNSTLQSQVEALEAEKAQTQLAQSAKTDEAVEPCHLTETLECGKSGLNPEIDDFEVKNDDIAESPASVKRTHSESKAEIIEELRGFATETEDSSVEMSTTVSWISSPTISETQNPEESVIDDAENSNSEESSLSTLPAVSSLGSSQTQLPLGYCSSSSKKRKIESSSTPPHLQKEPSAVKIPRLRGPFDVYGSPDQQKPHLGGTSIKDNLGFPKAFVFHMPSSNGSALDPKE